MALPHIRNQSRLAALLYPKCSCVRDKRLKWSDANRSHTARGRVCLSASQEDMERSTCDTPRRP